MPRASSLESNEEPDDRGAPPSAPRSTPLTIVSGAVAGDDLERVAGSASDALGHPVAISLPALGAPVIWPHGAIPPEQLAEIVHYAEATVRGSAPELPAGLAHAVPIRIATEVVGVVVTVARKLASPEDLEDAGTERRAGDQLAWLEATAAAAAVTRLMREAHEVEVEDSRRTLLQALAAGPPADLEALLGQARGLGVDLSAGAVALSARWRRDGGPAPSLDLAAAPPALLVDLDGGRVLALIALAHGTAAERAAVTLANGLSARGMEVALSAPRRQPSALHEALREAMLLVELACSQDAGMSGQEETYRLLIGVLLRDPEELESLRSRTIASLIEYDAEHDTDLLTTLQTFLAHHGSTTETADAMQLHRHTVGYRLSRVHEVSGLSPYESDGRERLSLGLKAAQILAANEGLSKPG